MKKNILILLISILILSDAEGQLINKTINNNDSTLALYLSKRLERKGAFSADTCFNGFYAISFKLSKKGESYDFTYSKLLPQKYADTIKTLVSKLNESWSKTFLKNVLNKNATIIQPFYLSIFEDCIPKGIITLKDDKDTSFTDEQITNWSLINVLKLSGNELSTTFLNLFQFKNAATDLSNCMILPSFTIMRQPGRKRNN